MILTKKHVAFMLRSIRIEKGLSVEEVAEKLSKFDITIAPKTVYNWETAQSMPNNVVFLALCYIYNIRDVIDSFGDGDSLDLGIFAGLNENEKWIIENYRSLSTDGQDELRKYLNIFFASGLYALKHEPTAETSKSSDLSQAANQTQEQQQTDIANKVCDSPDEISATVQQSTEIETAKESNTEDIMTFKIASRNGKNEIHLPKEQ